MGNTNEKSPLNDGLTDEEGGGRYSRSNSLISRRSQNPDVNGHVLPPLAFQRVRRCLMRLPLQDGRQMKEEAIERVAKHIVVETYDPGKDIVMKGRPTKGIFMIVEGSAKVMSEKGDEVLANLSEGDFFGEVSLLFDIPCTARVQADANCVLAHLEPSSAKRLLRKVRMDILDWFVSRRYLPTSNDVDTERCLRRMTFTSLRSCPVFEDWGEDSLKTLILSLDPAPVVLYQPHTTVLCINDPPTSIYVIIRGSAIIQDNQSRKLVTINVGNQGDDPVVIGEEGHYLENKTSLSVTTTTCCEVIYMKEEWILNTLDEYPNDAGVSWKRRKTSWRALLSKREELKRKYPALLQFEVIYQMLKNSPVLCECSSHCVQHLALYGNPQEYTVNDCACISEEINAGCLVLVLTGELELVTDSQMRYVYTVSEGEVFCPGDWMGGGQLVARSDSLTFKVDGSVVSETFEKFPNCILQFPPEPP